MAYIELKKKYDKSNSFMFNLAVTNIVEKGMKVCTKITDEAIEEIKGNDLFPKHYLQGVVELSRELSREVTPAELIQFCETEEILDVQSYAEKISRHRLEAIAYNAVTILREEGYSVEDVMDMLNIDEDDMIKLGFDLGV